MPVLTGTGGVISVEVPRRQISVERPPSGVKSAVVIRGPKGDAGAGSEGEITEIVESVVLGHELDSAPHPAYDDMPSLTLLFENGLT